MSETLKNWWADIQSVLNYEFVELGGINLTLNGIIKLLLVMTLVVVLERLFRSFLRRRVLARTDLEPELQFAVSRFAGYCFIIVGFFFALRVVHLDLSSLAVVAGGLGVGIGFGLQNIVSNFISGLIILAERLHCHRPSHRSRRGRRAGPENQLAKHHRPHERQHCHHRAQLRSHREPGHELELWRP